MASWTHHRLSHHLAKHVECGGIPGLDPHVTAKSYNDYGHGVDE
jgi:hypothetical protein